MKKSFRVIYLIAIALITILCIACGIYRNVIKDSGKNVHFSVNGSNQTTLDEDLDVFESVNISADAADVRVEYGDTYHLYYCFPKGEEPDVEVKDGTLSITVNGGIDIQIGINNSAYEMVLTVPEGTVIENFTCDADAGNVENSEVTINHITLTADAGNVDFRDCKLGTIEVTCDAGNVELNNVTFDSGNFTADAGNINLSDCTFAEAECSADMGDIDVSGDYDSLKAECSVGDINAETSRNVSDVQWDLNADLGDVEVNGMKQSGFHSSFHSESDDSTHETDDETEHEEEHTF